MLAVEQNPVEPSARDYLDGVVGRQARPEPDLRRARPQRALERVFRQIHSNFAPDSLTTLAHFACSVVIHLPRLSGESVRTSVPCFANLSLMSCVLRIFLSSPFSFVTVSRGMPTGPTTPWYEPVSNPGRPCSATVGVSGALGTRCALEIASALSLPPVTWGHVASMPLKRTCAWPPTTPVMASAPPLYGM